MVIPFPHLGSPQDPPLVLNDAVQAYQIGNGSSTWLGISTACYPSPASVHGLLSGDNERLKLCPRVQTPAPGLGRLHATVPGICSVQTRSRRTLPDLVVGSTPLHNPAARSVLETAPCRWCSSPTPIWAAESTSHPLHYLGHNALFCRHIPTQGLILLPCLALMTARLVGTVW